MTVVTVLVLSSTAGVYAATQTEGPATSSRNQHETSTREEEPQEPTTRPAPLTGVEVELAAAKEPVTGVMIENSPNARPQSGLDAADIVFESVSEGGITRFLALYQSELPGEVGSVRSVRPFFADWVMGFDAALAHVGGSPPALAIIDRRGTKTLNQMRHPGPYYRTGNRSAPHNMFARPAELRRLQKSLGYDTSEFEDFEWQDEQPTTESSTDSITINYSSQNYQARFNYNSASNRYLREMAGQTHRDGETNQQISVNNVVVAYMNVRIDAGTTRINTFDSGEALVFNNGEVAKGKWSQENPINRIRFTDQSGEQIKLNRGDTWIAVVPTGQTVSY